MMVISGSRRLVEIDGEENPELVECDLNPNMLKK
jgi:hypothetical protein